MGRRFNTTLPAPRAWSPPWARCLGGEHYDERGDASAIFPTKRNLERLAQHSGIETAIADATAHSLETIIPWVEEIDGEPHVRIPDGRGYPVISEPLATAFRA